jgi:hypothetical protein
MKVIPFLKSEVPHLRKSPKPYLICILGFQALFFGVTPGKNRLAIFVEKG